MAGERRAHWLAEVVSTCLLWETAQRNEWAAVPRCQAAQVMRLPAELEKTGPSAFCSLLSQLPVLLEQFCTSVSAPEVMVWPGTLLLKVVLMAWFGSLSTGGRWRSGISQNPA